MLYTRFGLEFPANESAEDTLRRLPNVRHDALVIYNSKDAAWIEGTLSAELEQCPPYYSIVLPQRTRLRGDSSGENSLFTSTTCIHARSVYKGQREIDHMGVLTIFAQKSIWLSCHLSLCFITDRLDKDIIGE